MAAPPEAAASFCIANGEKPLCAERLSSSTFKTLPPVLPLEDELLLEEELVLLEDVLEPVVDVLLEDELLLVEELELLLELVPPLPVQVGATKLPSCVPRKPKTLLNVWPGWGNCQPNSFVN
jgi:hypothetical protein